jgi:hypothetical protein
VEDSEAEAELQEQQEKPGLWEIQLGTS